MVPYNLTDDLRLRLFWNFWNSFLQIFTHSSCQIEILCSPPNQEKFWTLKIFLDARVHVVDLLKDYQPWECFWFSSIDRLDVLKNEGCPIGLLPPLPNEQNCWTFRICHGAKNFEHYYRLSDIGGIIDLTSLRFDPADIGLFLPEPTNTIAALPEDPLKAIAAIKSTRSQWNHDSGDPSSDPDGHHAKPISQGVAEDIMREELSDHAKPKSVSKDSRDSTLQLLNSIATHYPSLRDDGDYARVSVKKGVEDDMATEQSAIAQDHKGFNKLVWTGCLKVFPRELRNQIMDDYFDWRWVGAPPLLVALANCIPSLEKDQVYGRYYEALESFNRTGTFLLSYAGRWAFGNMTLAQIVSVSTLEINLDYFCHFDWLDQTISALADICETLNWRTIVIREPKYCTDPAHRKDEAEIISCLLSSVSMNSSTPKLKRIEYHTQGYDKEEKRKVWERPPVPCETNEQSNSREEINRLRRMGKLRHHQKLIKPLIEEINASLDIKAALETVPSTGADLFWFWNMEEYAYRHRYRSRSPLVEPVRGDYAALESNVTREPSPMKQRLEKLRSHSW